MKLNRQEPIDRATIATMFERAEQAMGFTYPEPNKGYSVCALSKNGALYEGASYNSTTYTLTMHSEATALANAAMHGDTDIVAITGPNCHICKQLLWESALKSGIDLLVITEHDGEYTQTPISELMPQAWPELQ